MAAAADAAGAAGMPCLLFLTGPTKEGDRLYGDFRLPEVDSASRLLLGRPAWPPEAPPPADTPYVPIALRGEDEARLLAGRLVSLRGGVFERYASAVSLEELAERVAALPRERFGAAVAEGRTYRCDVESHNATYSSAEKQAVRESVLSRVRPAGRVSLREPDDVFVVFADHGLRTARKGEPRLPAVGCHFGRLVPGARGVRNAVLQKYRLQDRTYLGPTSTIAELALYMANQGQAAPGRRVLDPFVGTGSLLVASAHFGASVTGTDIDFRVLHGYKRDRRGPTITDNFRQYGLPRPELLCCDHSARSVFADGARFDAIVCDPPYGVRAGARRSGSKRGEKRKGHTVGAGPERRNDYIPATLQYRPEDVMDDLFRFAVRRLEVGGRLVFLLPTHGKEELDVAGVERELPVHRCLRMVHVSVQTLREHFYRLCVTVEKHTAEGEDEDLERGTVFFGQFGTYREAAKMKLDERLRLQDDLAAAAARAGGASSGGAGAADEPAGDADADADAAADAAAMKKSRTSSS